MELVDIECELYRLIPSRFPPVSVFDGLVANDRLDQLAEIEARKERETRKERSSMAKMRQPLFMALSHASIMGPVSKRRTKRWKM